MSTTDLLAAHLAERPDTLRRNLNGVLRGKADVAQRLLVVLLPGGSVLFEDVPGVDKTTLAKALARRLAA